MGQQELYLYGVAVRRRMPSANFVALAKELNLSLPEQVDNVPRASPTTQPRLDEQSFFDEVLCIQGIEWYLALSCVFQILWICLCIRIYKRCKARRHVQVQASTTDGLLG